MLQRSYMLTVSAPTPFPEVSAELSKAVGAGADCIDVVMTKLLPSFFPRIRGEQITEKHEVSNEDETEP